MENFNLILFLTTTKAAAGGRPTVRAVASTATWQPPTVPVVPPAPHRAKHDTHGPRASSGGSSETWKTPPPLLAFPPGQTTPAQTPP